MANCALSGLKKVRIPDAVIARTLEVLQEFGQQKLEGLVLWLGEVTAEEASVQIAMVPEQYPLTSEMGIGYFVQGDALFHLNRTLSETGLRLIAQVHSHPREAYHSEADDRYAIVTAEGGLSFVVPNFGQAAADPASWAVYRLIDGGWQELSQRACKELLQLDDER